MHFKPFTFISVSCALLLALFTSAPTLAGVILSPTAVIGNTIGTSAGNINNTINQSGLSVGFTSGVTDFTTYIAGNPTHAGPGPSNAWSAPSTSLPGNIDFDLGGLFNIFQSALWTSFQGFGINNFDISIGSLLDFSDAVLVGNFNASESNPIAVQVFNTPLTGRYVRLGINSNHSPNVNVNFSEIAFDVASVPEPTTLALMGLGLAGIGWKRRKAA